MGENGKTITEMAAAFGVARRTVNEWRAIYPEFRSAVELGRERAADAVEVALFQRATGYTYDSEKIVTLASGPGVSIVERVPIREHCPPDVTAIQFFLKNRRPDDWRDRQQVDHVVSLEDLLDLAHDGRDAQGS